MGGGGQKGGHSACDVTCNFGFLETVPGDETESQTSTNLGHRGLQRYSLGISLYGKYFTVEVWGGKGEGEGGRWSPGRLSQALGSMDPGSHSFWGDEPQKSPRQDTAQPVPTRRPV